MCILKKYIILANLFISLISFGQNQITKDERIREIIKASWKSLHPRLLRYNTSSQIDQYFETLKTQVSKPITNQQYFILLSQLTTKVKCGHTYLNPWNQSEETINNFFSK